MIRNAQLVGAGGLSSVIALLLLTGSIQVGGNQTGSNGTTMLATHQQVLGQHGQEFVAVRQKQDEFVRRIHALEVDLRRFMGKGDRFTAEEGKRLEARIDRLTARLEVINDDMRSTHRSLMTHMVTSHEIGTATQ